MNKKCNECGRDYYNKAKKSRFCSHPCYSIWRGKNIRGTKHPLWINNSEKILKYSTIHMWLRREYGIANICEDDKCLGDCFNFNWALIKGKKYQKKRENYIKLCRSCHAFYDVKKDTGRKISEANKGRVPPNKGKRYLICPNIGRPYSESYLKKKPWLRKIKIA